MSFFGLQLGSVISGHVPDACPPKIEHVCSYVHSFSFTFSFLFSSMLIPFSFPPTRLFLQAPFTTSLHSLQTTNILIHPKLHTLLNNVVNDDDDEAMNEFFLLFVLIMQKVKEACLDSNKLIDDDMLLAIVQKVVLEMEKGQYLAYRSRSNHSSVSLLKQIWFQFNLYGGDEKHIWGLGLVYLLSSWSTNLMVCMIGHRCIQNVCFNLIYLGGDEKTYLGVRFGVFTFVTP